MILTDRNKFNSMPSLILPLGMIITT